ncbi:MAG: HPr family phosphocarrier protein [Gammaproteobacteria bacterium]|nr:HPr family phosphocarrier protein [Gammaproteobacteria bacterium]
MQKKTVVIVNKLGLHARAAARFVETASAFESEIEISSGENTVNGKSIMGLMMLAAARGSSVELIVRGRDEDKALMALLRLIEDRFGEDI